MPGEPGRLSCREVAAALPAILDSRAGSPAAVGEHVEGCLACQAELARYRKLLRMLAQLRTERVELAEGDLGELLEAIGGAAKRRAIRSALAGRPVAYGAGLLAGCLAAGGVVLVGRFRSSGRPAST